MLEPGYFQDKCDRMIEIYGELENYILNDIAQRLLKAGEMSGTADRMVWKLAQMGEHRSTILAKLSKITKKSRSELKRLLQEAVLTSWDDDVSTFNKLGIVPSEPLKNKDVMRLMDAEYIKSNGELENLTRTTLDKSQKDLINMLDTAEVRVAAGVQSYSSAICGILDDYAEDGIRVGYPTGAERTLESAVRMIVVTSMNQTSAQVTNYYIAEGNVEYVLVSAHLGARPQAKGQPYLAGHENWQGRAYKIRGSEEGFPNLLESTGYDITQDGKGRVADPRGLHGYNCRHSHRPWDKDLRNPYLDENGNLKIDTEENRRIYELQQRQRAMERGIRKTKRELLVKKQELDGIAETDVKDILQPQYDKLALKLREQNKAYGDYCEQNGFDRQEDRLKAAGFKRKQAAEANGRATAESNRVQNESEYLKAAENGDTIKSAHKTVDRPIIGQKEIIEQAKSLGDKLVYQYDNGEPVGNYLNQQLGYDGLPRVVSTAEFDTLSKKTQVLYRGVTDYKDISAQEMVEQFKNGSFYSGRGIYGNGTYTDIDKSVAMYYAYDSGDNGQIMEMVLSDDAKTVSYTDIFNEWEKLGMYKIRDDKKENYQKLIGNVGYYAAIKGYDAITLDGWQDKTHVVILNRTKVIIKE